MGYNGEQGARERHNTQEAGNLGVVGLLILSNM